jgi:hypothetical protein
MLPKSPRVRSNVAAPSRRARVLPNTVGCRYSPFRTGTAAVDHLKARAVDLFEHAARRRRARVEATRPTPSGAAPPPPEHYNAITAGTTTDGTPATVVSSPAAPWWREHTTAIIRAVISSLIVAGIIALITLVR